MERQRDGKA
jgi:zinc finger CCCH domain-containing protein 13